MGTLQVVYSSYKGIFLKYIKIPEFSVITSVSTESTPSFFIYSAYPNPAKNRINIKLDYDQSVYSKSIDIKLFNMSGVDITNQLSYSVENESAFSLRIVNDISNIKTGVYFLQIKLGNKIDTVPFVLE